MCMTEALCQAVRKYDLHEWGNRFFASRDLPESVVSDYVSNVRLLTVVVVANLAL